jgi:tetratricopeptide (TPR) repeat protein
LAYHSLKQYEKAIPAFRKALELDGQLESAALFLGIDYCKIDSAEEAVKPLEMALTLRPQDTDAHLWLGRALLAKGIYPEAIPLNVVVLGCVNTI